VTKMDIHLAAKRDDVASIKLLIDAGANINLSSPTSKSMPLFKAAQQGHSKALKCLLQYRGTSGMNIDEMNLKKRTPLHYAVKGDHMDTAKILLDAGANLNIKCDKSEETSLYAAAHDKNSDMVKLLLRYPVFNLRIR
jgi:ankyrin repeat protein